MGSFASLSVTVHFSGDRRRSYRPSMAGNDGGFDVAAAVQHVPQHFLQARQRSLAGDVVGGANFLGRDQAESAAHRFRRVMERGFQRDLGIVQAIGIELHFGPAGASAEEIYGAAFANHFYRPLPSVGTTDRFNHYIAATLLRSQRANRLDHIRHLGGLNDFVRAHVLGGDYLFVAFHHRNHVAADGSRHLDKHQSDGAAADDGHRVTDFDAGFMQAAQYAGQRFGHGRVFEAHVGRDDQHIGFDDAARDADVFRIGSIIEEQVFAKVFLVLGAIKAHLAGSRIQRDYAHALLEAVDTLANFLDHSGQFVSEQGGRHNHAGVVAALIHLEIGAAGESDLYLDQDLAFFHARNWHSF